MTSTQIRPTVNTKRLIHLAEWLGAQKARLDLGLPSEWDQEHWLTYVNGELEKETGCGTACCIAGKVALEDGGIPVISEPFWDADDGRYAERPVRFLANEEYDINAMASMAVFAPDAPLDSAVEVKLYAIEQLGLSGIEADYLFEETNTYERAIDVIRIILNAGNLVDELGYL